MNSIFDKFTYNYVFSIKVKVFELCLLSDSPDACDTFISSVTIPLTEEEYRVIQNAKGWGCSFASIASLADLYEEVETISYNQEYERLRAEHPEISRIDANFIDIIDISW